MYLQHMQDFVRWQTLSGRSLHAPKPRPLELESWIEALTAVQKRLHDFAPSERTAREVIERETERYRKLTDVSRLAFRPVSFSSQFKFEFEFEFEFNLNSILHRLRHLADAKLLALDRLCLKSDDVAHLDEFPDDDDSDLTQIQSHCALIDCLLKTATLAVTKRSEFAAETAELRDLLKQARDQHVVHEKRVEKKNETKFIIDEYKTKLQEARRETEMKKEELAKIAKEKMVLKDAADVALAAASDASIQIDTLRAALTDADDQIKDARRAQKLAEESLLSDDEERRELEELRCRLEEKDFIIDELTSAEISILLCRAFSKL